MTLDSERIDIAIVGGVAAGLNAALVLGRARRAAIVFDAGRPRNAAAPHAYGFLGHDGIAGTELLRRGRAEVRGYGVGIVDARVLDITPAADDRFIVTTSAGVWEARTIMLATGLADLLPPIDGLAEIWGSVLVGVLLRHSQARVAGRQPQRPANFLRDRPVAIRRGHQGYRRFARSDERPGHPRALLDGRSRQQDQGREAARPCRAAAP